MSQPERPLVALNLSNRSVHLIDSRWQLDEAITCSAVTETPVLMQFIAEEDDVASGSRSPMTTPRIGG